MGKYTVCMGGARVRASVCVRAWVRACAQLRAAARMGSHTHTLTLRGICERFGGVGRCKSRGVSGNRRFDLGLPGGDHTRVEVDLWTKP